MSFRLKTILGVALIEAVLLSILVWSGLRYIETSNQREFTQRAVATVRAFAVTTKDAVLSSDLASLDSFISELMTFPGVQYARVRDADDRILASGGDAALLAREYRLDVELADVDDGVFDTFAEIVEADTMFGRVEIGLSIQVVHDVIADARRYGTTIALVEMGLVALFSFMLGLYLTRQLANLTEASERIADGEWGYQVPVRGKDELATAATAFNLMSGQIKASYQEITDREQNLRTVLENIQDGILLADLDANVLSRNPAADAIFGFAADAPDTPGLGDLILADDWAELSPQIAGRNAAFWGELQEVTGIRCDGRTFTMELTLSRTVQAGHEVLVAVVRDIQVRKQAEEQLRLRERIIAAAPTGVVIADATREHRPLVYVNPAFETITGYRADQVLGRNCRLLQGEDTDPTAIAQIRAAIDEERDTRVLLRNYRADGTGFWNELIITPIRDEHGQLTHFVGLQNDVTERVEGQHQLVEQEAHLRGVLDATHDAIVVTDDHGLVESFNLGAETMFGHRAGEVIGHNVSMLVPSPHRKRHDDYMRAYRETEVSHIIGVEREFEARHADGHEFPIALRVNEMVKDGKRHFIGVIHDITERKQKESALQRAKEAAEEGAAAKSQFLANMSHEIRTPMHGVLGALEMMRDTPLNRVQSRYLETANSSAEVLLTVIDEILDFSRLEAGKLRIEMLDFYPRKAVEDVIAMLSQPAFDKHLELASYIEPDVPDRLKGDPVRLRQILINLVGNAVKFTERGEIVVNVTIEHGDANEITLMFKVKDTGIGIAQGKREGLFDAFIQADGSTSRRFGGTGLGLSISRRLVELMGGEIGVESHEGEGSTFWFSLPLGVVTKGASSARYQDFAGRRILIVDDNATNRIIMHRYLSGWGSSPGSASDGHEAIAKMQDSAASGQPYDLAILDYHMPGMNGAKLSRQIRANDKLRGTRLLMVSSETYSEQIEGVAEVDIWLSKPLRQSDLRDAIATCFGELEPAVDAEPVPAKGVNFDGEQVLLVEDNPVSQSLAREMLRRRGLNVQSASNGLEAVELATHDKFDVILMDVQMPELDGYEATRRILDWEQNSGRRHTPIIALTAHALPQDRERCFAAGMDDYLVKPYNQESLSNIIFRWLSPPCTDQSHETPVTQAPVFEPEKIAEIRTVMGNNFPTLLKQFHATLEQHQKRILAALDANDRPSMIEAVHRVKNNAGDLGASLLLDLATELERGLQGGELDKPLAQELLSEAKTVLKAATDLINGESQ
ncbi:MAG: PAS domain S-box protein [Sulfitobacter sp.]|nr:PAS domain S-box protein [Sulfitobacter sp.]